MQIGKKNIQTIVEVKTQGVLAHLHVVGVLCHAATN